MREAVVHLVDSLEIDGEQPHRRARGRLAREQVERDPPVRFGGRQHPGHDVDRLIHLGEALAP